MTGQETGGEPRKNEVYPGMSLEELDNATKAIPGSQSERIEAIRRGIKIAIVRTQNGKVTKVIPSTVLGTEYSSGTTTAKVAVGKDHYPIRIVKDPGVVFLRRGAKSGKYYFIDDAGHEGRVAKVNFVNSERGKS